MTTTRNEFNLFYFFVFCSTFLSIYYLTTILFLKIRAQQLSVDMENRYRWSLTLSVSRLAAGHLSQISTKWHIRYWTRFIILSQRRRFGSFVVIMLSACPVLSHLTTHLNINRFACRSHFPNDKPTIRDPFCHRHQWRRWPRIIVLCKPISMCPRHGAHLTASHSRVATNQPST